MRRKEPGPGRRTRRRHRETHRSRSPVALFGSALHGAGDLREFARGPVGSGFGFPPEQLFEQFRSEGLANFRGKLPQEFDSALVASEVLLVPQGLLAELVDLRVPCLELLFVFGAGHGTIVGPRVHAGNVRGRRVPFHARWRNFWLLCG